MSERPFRFIVYFEEGEYHADCIDAGAVGVGESIWQALADLAETLIALANVSQEKNLRLRAPARRDDEQLYAELTGPDKAAGTEAAHARGVVRVGEMTLSADRSKAAASSFDIEEVHLAAAGA